MLGLVLAAGDAGAAAPDLARERRLADEIVETILDGEPVMLDARGLRFLAIDTPPDTEPARGAVLILHGRGYHPDWADVVQPLRTALPENGWRTLSLQMPVLRKDARYYDYVPLFPAAFPRIEAGIAYLRGQGIDRIVLLAHSCGVHMAMAWIAETGDRDIDAFIGIGMGATDYRQYMARPFPLDRMRVPVLDLYGQDDYPAVIRMAPERAAALVHPYSRQVRIPAADHYFTDRGDALVAAVRDWLARLPSGK